MEPQRSNREYREVPIVCTNDVACRRLSTMLPGVHDAVDEAHLQALRLVLPHVMSAPSTIFNSMSTSWVRVRMNWMTVSCW